MCPTRNASALLAALSTALAVKALKSSQSQARSDYLIPRSYTAIKQNRAVSAAGPSIWNGLPFELRSLPRDFSSSFYSLLGLGALLSSYLEGALYKFYR